MNESDKSNAENKAIKINKTLVGLDGDCKSRFEACKAL